MKISKGINFSFKKEDLDVKKIGNLVFEFFINNLGFVFILFFIGMVAFSSVLIYKYVYGSVWGENEKNAYLQEIKKDNLNFKASVFNDIIGEIEKRNLKYQGENRSGIRDIFGIN